MPSARDGHDNGDFTLGSFDAGVRIGITANSSTTVDLRDLKLADRSGADIATSLPQSQAVITINNLFIAQREAGTLRVASDGTMTNLRTIQLNLDDGSPMNLASAPGSYYDFSVPAYQYPAGKQDANIAIAMLSHLSCTKNVPLSDGLNPLAGFGTTYTLPAGNADGDNNIDIDDATLVGGYFGTNRTDAATSAEMARSASRPEVSGNAIACLCSGAHRFEDVSWRLMTVADVSVLL
jgi:hypothetical protein